MQDFRNLVVWQKAHTLAMDTFSASATLRDLREYWLRDQMMRAAISIPSNLAEGCGRTGDVEMRRFTRVSLGSASELEYHLLLARDLGLIHKPAYERLATAVVEVKRMLSGLVARLSEQIKADS